MADFVSGENGPLTTGVDRGADFTGGAGNDTFTADNTGDDVSSTADSLDGGAGTDTLDIFSDGAAGALPALTSVETLNIYDQDASVTLSSAQDSLTTVNLIRGDGDLTLHLRSNVATVGLTDIVAVGAGNAVGVVIADTSTATTLAVNLNGITAAGAAGDENVDIDGAALTTVNVTTSGVASTFDTLDVESATSISINAGAALTTVLETGATAASLSLSGAAAVNLGTLDTAINTVTSTATGALTAAIGGAVDTVLTAGSGNDVITASTANSFATTDALAVNGGAGTDILIIEDSDDVSSTTEGGRYTNFETVRVSESYDGDFIAGITALQLTGAISQSYTDLTATQAANIQVRGDEESATFALKTATGSADALTLTMGTGLTANAATNIVVGMTVTGFETLNIVENGGATATAGGDRTATIAGFTGATLNDINLSGRAVSLLDIATTVAVNIDGSALTGDGDTTSTGLTVDGSAVAGSVITGSGVRDSFTVGAEGSTYDGGAGNDAFSATVALINADGATDLTLVGGAGTDTLTLTDTTGNTLIDTHFTNLSGFEKLTLTNTGAADTSITTGAAFNAAFASGATITSGVIAAARDITISAGLSTVATTVSIAATSQTGALTETNSITTGSGADTVTYTDADWVGTTGGAQGTIVIDTRGGNDTISVTVGTLVAADAGGSVSTGLAISITGGTGQDSITKVGTNSDNAVGVAHFVFAAGDSTTTAYDSITGFDMATNTTFSDGLNFAGTAAIGTLATNEDYGTILSHSITAGVATFDDAAAYSTALVINSSRLADVVGYLAANTATNDVVAFAYDSDASGTADATMVYHNGSTDSLVLLVGVTGADALITTNASAGTGDIFVL